MNYYKGSTMEVLEKTLEVDGTIDGNHHLILDNENIPIEGPVRVKVLIKPAGEKGTGAAIKKFNGILKESKLDGLDFQKKARSEWDHRE